MNVDQILAGHAEIVKKFGPWTAHNINLGLGVGTMGDAWRRQWRVDCLRSPINRFSEKQINSLRILDLACSEGLFAVEFARVGAQTVGLEIRETHLAKAEFARKVLGLDNCRFVQGDVRAIPAELGRFDVVLCVGILYHLNFPDCVLFLRDVAARSSDLVIVDSHFAYDNITESVLPLSEMRRYEFEGHIYRGREITEHAAHVTPAEKAKIHLWASIDNDVSVWLEERDVIRILDGAGFDLVLREFPNATYRSNNPDRPTLTFKRKV
jgi:SAM-dependent methyltransferase